jgi:hypothetical protein
MKNVCGYNKQDLIYIRQFIKEINNEIVLRISPSGAWECSLPKYRIYLGAKKISKDLDYSWQTWYKKQEFYIGDNIFRRIISLLHEIGHFETFNVDEWDARNKIEKKLVKAYINDKISYDDLNYAYWNLPNEYKATKWAIEYYKNNRAKCEKLAAMLGLTS